MKALQELVFAHGAQHGSTSHTQKIFGKLQHCHTAAMGYHLSQCSSKTCGEQSYVYHSCGDRHCLFCGALAANDWLENKTNELLPTAYYHVVFTLPHELNGLILGHRTLLYNLLLEASAYTLLKLGADPSYLGGQPGIVSVLHTWGQQLSFHPHVHCVVSAGGVNAQGQWIKAKRKNSNFLFPKAVMQVIFKAYFLKRLRALLKAQKLHHHASKAIMEKIGYKKWEVYAKKPFAGPEEVLKYLGRYTHKTAIGKDRIKQVDPAAQTVSFAYKDYREKTTEGQKKTLTLSIQEFCRRLEQHFLPHRYVRIRSYGYLRNHGRRQRLAGLRAQLGLKQQGPKPKLELWLRVAELIGKDIRLCPKCQKAPLQEIEVKPRPYLRPSHFPNKASPNF
jgi:Putative transposase/Transposase zinc-binding domain